LLVMDNLRAHKTTEVQAVLDRSGFAYRYLPAYSPESSRRGELLPRASHGTVRADHAYGSLDQSIRAPGQAGLIPAACEDLATRLLATSSVR
jgi:hypothetical protein